MSTRRERMHTLEQFGAQVLIWGVVGFAVLLSQRIARILRIPAAVLVLVLAAAVGTVLGAHRPHLALVVDVVTVALVVILFDGGMHLGRRFRSAAGPIVSLGTLGTFLTAAFIALAAHFLFGIGTSTALALGAALAPTDPAVVFSVLAHRELTGKTSAILEGESGVNDPAGIALLLGFAAFATSSHGSAGQIAATFAVQMCVGAVVGMLGGWLLRVVHARPTPTTVAPEPLRILAVVLTIYGLAVVLHGSGFLAVLLAGIVFADEPERPGRAVRQFHGTLAHLGEIVAFVMLGLSFRLSDLTAGHAWLIGLMLTALLIFVLRPLAVLPLLIPVRLTRGERIFIGWAGLKGAVPILLGALAVHAGVPDSTRLYAVVFVVVALSVCVQGATLSTVAERLGVATRPAPAD
ncbi:sodium/proton antiporter, CPA1 family [Acidothermus cellulolyticus 11B]|uniref:Sodium/proton antiporter, CPA1 family n=2 Tax=Acidothermus cellulolyticus TaxID=28049 RepID=A0LWE7_ACIC1|nr:sodium/proton antiporter, CPA1 family [Acidothermus cellulolyticus 11B]